MKCNEHKYICQYPISICENQKLKSPIDSFNLVLECFEKSTFSLYTYRVWTWTLHMEQKIESINKDSI